jgi:hypothetical protein
MGCDTGQDNEKPVHRVWVDEFLLAACQVTNVEYAHFLRASTSLPPPFWNDPAFSHPQQPVVGVSWHEAVLYCKWLSATAGQNFRLPTEAEWERAARGGNHDAGAPYPWGNKPPSELPDYAARCDAYWKTGPEPVGRAEPNAYGLYNMCDNVHEWCSDWYAAEYYAVSPERNPRGPESGTRRASRGGSWRHHIKMSRCAARSSIPPEFQYADYGFRVACEVQSDRGQRYRILMPDLATHYLEEIKRQFRGHKRMGEAAMAQLENKDFFIALDPESNSVAVIVKHIAGNARSRFTDFLTTDGEKPDRFRDQEFEVSASTTREDVLRWWEQGWAQVFPTLDALRPEDVQRIVTIRLEPHTVMQALNRALAHYGQHIGQIVFLAKHLRSARWQTLSIPRGKSEDYKTSSPQGFRQGTHDTKA